jgi:hypothetical protein
VCKNRRREEWGWKGSKEVTCSCARVVRCASIRSWSSLANLCYAVRKGRVLGIFYSWDECRLHVEGVPNEFKGFYTVHEAQTYLDLSHSSSALLAHFLDLRNFCSNIHLNYEFLTAAGHAIPELTRIDSFTPSIEAFTQFDSYLTAWTTANALGSRTPTSLTKFLLDQYGDMPTENAPRGGNAFHVGKGKDSKGNKGKGGKGKDPNKGKGRGSKRTYDNTGTSLFTFASSSSSSSDQQAKRPRVTSNTTQPLTAEHNPSKP